MDTIQFLSLALIDGSQLLNILIAAAGLGLVIFFHELGHFAVAKWCDVNVERFSIGFGPPILARKWGETEYWLSWIPFGGYVKMLGQDDMDPGQMVDDEIAEDPRSYSAKTVAQRMAIISAGVIMNVITGYIFFAIAFTQGVETINRGIGVVQVGMPGWTQGVRSGDTFTEINGREVATFEDILRGTALSRGAIQIKGYHADGETFEYTIVPQKTEIVRKLGLNPRSSLQIAQSQPDEIPHRLPGTASATVDFRSNDVIRQVDGVEIKDYLELTRVLHEKADKTLEIAVERDSGSEQDSTTLVTLELPPQKFLGFGMTMWTGTVDAIRVGSPAEAAGMQIGDKITFVDGLEVGKDLDPVRLTEYFSERAGQEVKIQVTRETEGQAANEETLTLIPEDRDPWSEPPSVPETPLSIPSIGAAYHMIPKVRAIEEGGPADKAGIQVRDTIVKVILKRKPDAPLDLLPNDVEVIEVGKENWAFIFWTIQENARSREVQFVLKDREEEKVAITPAPVEDWFMPTDRGLLFKPETTVIRSDNLSTAFAMAGRYTVSQIEDIYLTIRGLFTRDISHKGLSGPLRIAGMAYGFADLGIGHFLRFLGLISINLAVINFLPIPILDGGHMVFLIWEGVQRKKPPERVVNAAHLFGLVLILSMMVFVFYQDILSFIS